MILGNFKYILRTSMMAVKLEFLYIIYLFLTFILKFIIYLDIMPHPDIVKRGTLFSFWLFHVPKAHSNCSHLKTLPNLNMAAISIIPNMECRKADILMRYTVNISSYSFGGPWWFKIFFVYTQKWNNWTAWKWYVCTYCGF